MTSVAPRACDLCGPQGLPASVARGLSTGLPRPGWVPRGAAPSLPRPSVLWSGPSGPSLSPASFVSRCGERGPSDARGARPPPVTTAALVSVGRFHTCAVPCNPAAPARSSHLPGLWAAENGGPRGLLWSFSFLCLFDFAEPPASGRQTAPPATAQGGLELSPDFIFMQRHGNRVQSKTRAQGSLPKARPC